MTKPIEWTQAARAGRRRLLLGLSAMLGACAEPYVVPGGPVYTPAPPSPPPPRRVAVLDVEGRVEVLHAGRAYEGRDGMPLHRGDVVRTLPSSYALMRFDDGDACWLDYDTRIRVGSVFVFFGRVFASVRGVFQIDSEFVAASSEGTQYTVSVARGRPDYSVAVRTGSVLCQPRQGAWRPVRLQAGQRLRGRGAAPPAADRLDLREADAEFGWVPRIRTAPERFRDPFPRERIERPGYPSAPPPPSGPILR